MSERALHIVDRLRGIYTVPVNDGAGLLDGKDTFTAAEPFYTPPIQREAADLIEEMLAALQGVVRVADRKTTEFDAARVAIAKASPPTPTTGRS